MTVSDLEKSHPTLVDACNLILGNPRYKSIWQVGKNKNGFLIEFAGTEKRVSVWVPVCINGIYQEIVSKVGPTGVINIELLHTWGDPPEYNGGKSKHWQDLDEMLEYLDNIKYNS